MGEGKRLVPGVKRARSGGEEGKKKKEKEEEGEENTVVSQPAKATATATPTATAPTAKKPLGGLVSYASSDEDDE